MTFFYNLNIDITLHREDGPAIICENDEIFVYDNGTKIKTGIPVNSCIGINKKFTSTKNLLECPYFINNRHINAREFEMFKYVMDIV